jgi:tetratricopeptide (TPR) repeat protein
MTTQAETLARGREYHQAGDLGRAEEVYRRILRSEPRAAAVWFALGQVCEAGRRLAEAAACFRQGLEIEPHHPEGHFQLGSALSQQGQYAEAEAAYRRCLQLKSDHLAALVNLGYVLGEHDRLDDARDCYERAVQLRPDVAEAHHNLGNALRDQGQLDRALASYDQALRLRPEYGKAYINRGIALVARGDIDEALLSLERGAALKPDLADAHSSLGAALSCQLRFDEALACYERALALNPEFAEAAWNRALIWLLRGDYERGWPAYEWRWRCKRTTLGGTVLKTVLQALPRPRWDGTPLHGRTILLYAEQGLGDTIQFIRYALLVKARGGRVIVQCQNALLSLLSQSPGIDGLAGWGVPPPPHDVWLPLMSLPAVFHTTLETIPAEIPYIIPDPALVAHWRRELAPVRGFRIGICWQGSPRHPWDRHRSVRLEQFEPLARVDGVRLISLQKGHGSEQLRALGGRFSVLSLGELFNEDAGPFLDTAAVLANLDLVVSVDSAPAHLAGAMGVPAWVVLPYAPDWRWLLGRADSVWYPTLRLFRQERFGDWPGVFRQMAEALPREVVARPPRQRLCIEVAPGELFDRIATMEVQSERITDEAELRRVRAELAELAAVREEALPPSPELAELAGTLKAVNGRLAEIEDEIHRCEQRQDFGPRFVELARAAHHEKDRRAAIQQTINKLLRWRAGERGRA